MSQSAPDCAALYLDLLKKALSGSLYDESSWAILEPRRFGGVHNFLRNAIIKALCKRSLLLVKKKHSDRQLRESGKDWPMIGFTMVGHQRLDNIRTCIERVLADRIPGDFVECGVWRGGSSIFAKAVFNIHGAADRKVWLADSFEGMPVQSESDKIDPDLGDALEVSREEVENNFRRFDLLDNNVRFVKGWFHESLPKAPIEQIAILRLDGDYYRSTMDALDNLYVKLSDGGFVIIDDYIYLAGCKQAVTEFRAKHGITAALMEDAYLVYWRKPFASKKP